MNTVNKYRVTEWERMYHDLYQEYDECRNALNKTKDTLLESQRILNLTSDFIAFLGLSEDLEHFTKLKDRVRGKQPISGEKEGLRGINQ